VFFQALKLILSILSVNNAIRLLNSLKSARNARLYSAKNANAKIVIAMNLKLSTVL